MAVDTRVAAESDEQCLTELRKAMSVLTVPGLPPSVRREPIQARRDGRTYVYFIGGNGTPIKIGLSAQPFERLAALQTAHWTRLRILAKFEGTLADEASLHRRFAEARLVGEWFERTDDLLEEIVSHCVPFSPIHVDGGGA